MAVPTKFSATATAEGEHAENLLAALVLLIVFVVALLWMLTAS